MALMAGYVRVGVGLINEKPGMNITLTAFYLNNNHQATKRSLKKLIKLGFVIEKKLFIAPTKYYFPRDFVKGEDKEETRNKMITEIRNRQKEFEATRKFNLS